MQGNVPIESGKAGIRHFLVVLDSSNTIFATEDFKAIVAIGESKERKIKKPEEVGIIGFANELFGEYITPRLSTVDQQTMGKSARSSMFDLVEKKK